MRNRIIAFLLVFAILGIAFFSARAKERYTRLDRLSERMAERERSLVSLRTQTSAPGLHATFQSGVLSVTESDGETAVFYTDFTKPFLYREAGFAALYEYPYSCFYRITENTGEVSVFDTLLPVSAVRFSGGGSFVVLNDADSTVSVFDRNGEKMLTFSSSLPIADIALSHEGKRLLVVTVSMKEKGSFYASCYRVRDGKRLYETDFSCEGLPLCLPDDERFFIASDAFSALIDRKGKQILLSERP